MFMNLYFLGENQFLPPMPLLILLSHEGLLCLYFTVNILQSSAVICNPPEPMNDTSGVQFFVPYSESEVSCVLIIIIYILYI